MFARVLKGFFLHVSKNKLLNKAAKRWGLKLGASQVVAGEGIESMVGKVKELNQQGLLCTLDHMGEFVTSIEDAIEATNQNIKTLETIAQEELNSQLSVKLTQLGIDLDQAFCKENMLRILHTAKKYNLFVNIDMEDYEHCQKTFDLLAELRKQYDNVGTVIQAYLYRSQEDIKALQGVTLRLVKGAYKESKDVAYQDQESIDDHFIELIKARLLSGSYTAIATHDHHIIEKVKAFVKENAIPRDTFEFQMLYGFRKELQHELVKEGYQMRVYVPFGNDWFAYYMRRLAERPQNISFALKGFFQNK